MDPKDLKQKIAREAANLLYQGVEKEYKQAKLKAAQTYRARILPTNLEVALELDEIAEETEGKERKEQLIQMRKEALKTMKLLNRFHPFLIGSVWRGTNRKGSDIDIALYHDTPSEIVSLLETTNLKIAKTQWTDVTKHGETKSSFHIHTETPTKQKIEIVVRSADEAGKKRKCEVFGDELKGLSTQELETLLKENPQQNFVPS